MYLLKSFGFNFLSAVLAFSIPSFLIQVMLLVKISPRPFIAVLFYISYFTLTYNISALRFTMAISFIMLATYYLLYKTSKLKFSIFVIIAFLFHNSALVGFAVYPFTKIKASAFFLCCLLILSFLFAVLPIEVDAFVRMVKNLPIDLLQNDLIQRKLNSYLTGTYSFKYGLKPQAIPYFFFGILYIYYLKYIKFEAYKIFVTLYCWGVFIYFFFNSLSGLTRFGLYFLPFLGIPIAYIIQYSKSQSNSLIIYYSTMFYLIVRFTTEFYILLRY